MRTLLPFLLLSAAALADEVCVDLSTVMDTISGLAVIDSSGENQAYDASRRALSRAVSKLSPQDQRLLGQNLSLPGKEGDLVAFCKLDDAGGGGFFNADPLVPRYMQAIGQAPEIDACRIVDACFSEVQVRLARSGNLPAAQTAHKACGFPVPQ